MAIRRDGAAVRKRSADTEAELFDMARGGQRNRQRLGHGAALAHGDEVEHGKFQIGEGIHLAGQGRLRAWRVKFSREAGQGTPAWTDTIFPAAFTAIAGDLRQIKPAAGLRSDRHSNEVC